MTSERTMLYDFLPTPCVLLDLDRLDANIREMTDHAAAAGIHLRPHTKVHQSAWIAKRQIEAGASGIEVGTIDHAEVMCNEGLHDVVVAHPFSGVHKLDVLRRVVSNPRNEVTLVVDMVEQALAIAEVGRAAGRPIPVLLKIDTGGPTPRFGVAPGIPAVRAAAQLASIEGVVFSGIYGHEKGATHDDAERSRKAADEAAMLCDTAREIRAAGIECRDVSTGASPTFRATCELIKEGKFPEITEIHPGNCVIGDIGYMTKGANTRQSCAVTVLTSVMSTAHDTYAVLDAGIKTLGADSLIGNRDEPGFFWQDMPSYGSVQRRPDLWLGQLHAESSSIFYRSSDRLGLGQRIEIVPNNVTLVINLHSHLYGVRNGVLEEVVAVSGRGVGN